MEENRNYTYTYRKKEEKPKNIAAIAISVIAVVFFCAAVVIGVSSGKKKAKNEISVSESINAASVVSEADSTVADLPNYKPGKYSVDTGGYTLLLRREPKKDAEAILEIPDHKEIEINEVYYDESAADENYRSWGKLEYLGHTGWVALNYLKKEYSDTVVTPDDLNTTEEPTRPPAPAEGYQPGDYTVATGGSTLRFKVEPSRNSDVIRNLPDGVIVRVTEIVEVEGETDEYRYWGKITYEDKTGFVSMAFLDKYQ